MSPLGRARALKSRTQRKVRKESVVALAKREMKSYLENPIRYRSDCSALIVASIGLASLDLPVLLVTLISEYSASINEEKFFAEYSEQKSWDIAALIQKKAKIGN